jgi:hypothetical protein
MAREVSSITRVGTSEPFELQTSRSQISYHNTLFKYGYNSDIINVNETVWDAGGIYAYPGSAVAMTVTSAGGATDSGVKVLVCGLDTNYEELEEEVTLNASGTATTSGLFIRVFRAYVSGSTSPTGNITIANGGTTYAQITNGENQTLMAVYTVPAGKTLYINEGIATHGTATSGGVFMTVRFMVRPYGGVMRTQVKLDVVESQIYYPFAYPIKVTEKSDVEVRAICNKNQSNAISASFNGVLVVNGDTL